MRFPGCVRQAQVLGRSAVRSLRGCDAADLGCEGSAPVRAQEGTAVMSAYDEQRAAERHADGRMLVWLRKQLNADLRRARVDERISRECGDTLSLGIARDQVDLFRALLVWHRRMDSWHSTRGDPDYASVLLTADTVIAIVRHVAYGYRQRPGWRDEWGPR
jgi:hypothetical protein